MSLHQAFTLLDGGVRILQVRAVSVTSNLNALQSLQCLGFLFQLLDHSVDGIAIKDQLIQPQNLRFT